MDLILQEISLACSAWRVRSFGIFIEEFVTYFDTSVAMAAAMMGVYGGVYTLAGKAKVKVFRENPKLHAHFHFLIFLMLHM